MLSVYSKYGAPTAPQEPPMNLSLAKDGPAPDRRSLVKAFAASLSGTSLEWYDFSVYSAAAALVVPQLFFPWSDPLTGTLLAFSTYAGGDVSRPLGGFGFVRLGDVVCRNQVVGLTLWW